MCFSFCCEAAGIGGFYGDNTKTASVAVKSRACASTTGILLSLFLKKNRQQSNQNSAAPPLERIDATGFIVAIIRSHLCGFLKERSTAQASPSVRALSRRKGESDRRVPKSPAGCNGKGRERIIRDAPCPVRPRGRCADER